MDSPSTPTPLSAQDARTTDNVGRASTATAARYAKATAATAIKEATPSPEAAARLQTAIPTTILSMERVRALLGMVGDFVFLCIV